jgi:hypothetical protein
MNTKTIRDRIKPESLVTLTREVVLNNPESKERKQFPSGIYQAKDLPVEIYKLGYVTTLVTHDENKPPVSSQTTQVESPKNSNKSTKENSSKSS